MNLFFPHGNRVLQSPMHALAAEQSDAEAEERAGLRPWRMGAVGCMAAKAPGRARRKGSNGRDGLASCMATTRRKRKPHGQRRVAQCERFNCSCGKQSRSDVIPLLSFHMQTNGGCADNHWRARPEPAACVAWVQNFPTRLRRRTIACRRRVAFRQHLLEKLMSLQFAPLCGHVLIRKISPSRAWLCSMAQAGPLEATGS